MYILLFFIFLALDLQYEFYYLFAQSAGAVE